MIVLSCDPGLSGAFALLDRSGVIAVHDMPTYMTKVNASANRRVLDDAALLGLMGGIVLCYEPDLFVLEKASGLPRQSASGAFNFGYGYGCVLTAARTLQLRIEQVPAPKWKGAMRVTADKRQARARASELLPKSSHLWPLAKHDGRAEAALLGLYGVKYLL